MLYLKGFLVLIFAIFFTAACIAEGRDRVVIAESKSYEASLFRQNCAICHGPEAEGKTLVDGRIVPSLRAGEFKAKTKADIYNQIAHGGNGMLPFRNAMTDRELKMMTEFVHESLRGEQ